MATQAFGLGMGGGPRRIQGFVAGLALALLGLGSRAEAVDPLQVATQLLRDRWDAESGLPEQGATALLQDAAGYLWVGTQGGAARFDGARFVTFGLRTSRVFHNDFVHALAQTPDGAVWVGTHEGIVRLHGNAEVLYSLGQGLPAQVVTAAAVSKSGTLWVGTGGGGLARFTKGRFEPVGPGNLDVRSMLATPEGVWVGTAGAGIFRIAGHEGAESVEPLAGFGPEAAATITALAVDPDGALWCGTPTGVFHLRDGPPERVRLGRGLESLNVASLCWDSTRTLWIGTKGSQLWRVRGYPALENVESIEVGDTVSAVLEDRSASVWFATVGGGLGRLRSPLMTTVGQEEGLSSRASVAVLQDREERIWVGSLSGLNLLTSLHSAVPVAPELLGRAQILALFEDRAGDLWVGTRQGLYRCRGKTCTGENVGVSEDIQAFAEDTEPRTLWIGTGRGLVRKTPSERRLFTVADGLPHDRVSLLFRDNEGTLWVGTEAGGLARFVDGHFQRLLSDENPDLAGAWVLSARQDTDGTLWFGTSAGLVHLRKNDLTIVRRRDGLTCADAFAILPGIGDDLWMSCNRGITRVRRSDLLAFENGRQPSVHVTAYKGRAVGLPGECVGSVSPAGIRTQDGRLWFSTLLGVVYLDPGRLTTPTPPPVVVESILPGDGPSAAAASAPGPFPAGTRHVELVYTALELVRQDELQFRYRLEGVDQSWTIAGNRRLAIYPNLGPGRYAFRVEAAVGDGPFGGTLSPVEFEIRPFFFQTLAFRVALTLAAIAALVAGYRVRVRGFAARRLELEALVDQRTTELQSSVDEQRRMASEMRAMAEEMRERSLRDPLTGLRNRRFLFEVLEPLARSSRGEGAGRDEAANTGLGVAMIDIDNFKRINDSFGHEAGDQVLRQFAERTAASIRPGDIAVRWGGEEFLVTLTATDPRHLAASVQRLRFAVSGAPFLLPDGSEEPLTCSAGFASLPFHLEGGPPIGVADLIGLADLGLLAAKRGGRNRSVGVIPGRRRGSTVEILRKALGNIEYALEEGVIDLTMVGS